jgi:hypothetical protein
MEATCSVTFKKLFAHRHVAAETADRREPAAVLKGLLTDEDADNPSQFAAYQYMRVPGAVDQKAYELQPSKITETDRTHALNPGRFVESGYTYVKDRFRAMKLLILASPGREFITSDWPCFDMKDSPDRPLLVRRSAEILVLFATFRFRPASARSSSLPISQALHRARRR